MIVPYSFHKHMILLVILMPKVVLIIIMIKDKTKKMIKENVNTTFDRGYL